MRPTVLVGWTEPDPMVADAINKLDRLLSLEEALIVEVAETGASKRLRSTQHRLLEHLREIGRTGDLT
jgi:hypothetical protein